MVSPGGDCEEKMPFETVTKRLEPISVERTKIYDRSADAKTFSIKPWEAEVDVREACYTDFNCPIGPTNPNGAIAFTPGKLDSIYFAEFGLENRIGCLKI